MISYDDIPSLQRNSPDLRFLDIAPPSFWHNPRTTTTPPLSERLRDLFADREGFKKLEKVTLGSLYGREDYTELRNVVKERGIDLQFSVIPDEIRAS